MSRDVAPALRGTRRIAVSEKPGKVHRVLGHIRIPLYRNAYSLVLSSVLTAGIGVAFWIVAARLFTEETVGINSAAISALMFLATLGQLNLVNGLNRFLPRAGTATGRIIGWSYTIAAAAGGLVAVIFLVGLRIWAKDLDFLMSSSWMRVWFVLSVMSWALFVLQDGVLAGLRQAQWVPAENAIYALLKIALVVALATSFTDSGLLLAWTLPVLPLLLGVNVLVFRKLVPRHVEETRNQPEAVGFSRVSHFVAGDYVASLTWMAATRLLPIVVLARVGAAATAHFYLAWTIAYTLHLVSHNMGMSMIAEAAHDPQGLPSYSYRTARQATLLLAPAVIVIVVAAPPILRLFGQSYADAGTPLLRLLAASALPAVITTIYAAILRAQRRVQALFVLMFIQATAVIVLSWWLLDTQGILGVGIAWFLSQTVIAGFLITVKLRPFWISQVDHRIVEVASAVRSFLKRRGVARRLRPFVSDAVERVADTIRTDVAGDPHRWETLTVFSTVSDVSTAAVGPAGGPAAAILKMASTDEGIATLDQHIVTLRGINQDRRLATWPGVVPEVLAVAEIDSRRVVVDSALPGLPLERFLLAASDPETLLAPPAELLAWYHRATASKRKIDDHLVDLLVRQPINAVRSHVAHRHTWVNALATLESRLSVALGGKTVTVSATHGDFAPGNILLSTDGASVVGIIDWDQAQACGLPDLDILFLILTSRMALQHRELGDVVVTLVERPAFATWEWDLLDRYAPILTRGIDAETLVLLTWLRHVASNLAKASAYSKNRTWLERNIGHVLTIR